MYLSATVLQLLCACSVCTTLYSVYSDMEFSMVKWKELCVDMERFDEEFLDKFSCTTEALTAEKIKASMSREAILRDITISDAKEVSRDFFFSAF